MTEREKAFIKWCLATLAGAFLAIALAIYGRECDYFGVTIVNDSGHDLSSARLLMRGEEIWSGAIPAGERRRPFVARRGEGELRLTVLPGSRTAAIGYFMAGYASRTTFTISPDAIEVDEWKGADEDSGIMAPMHQLAWLHLYMTDHLACADSREASYR